jgi:hypothetical protein
MSLVNTVGNRIPAKMYECMRTGKWTLVLSEPGSDLENLMRGYSKGISIPAQDTSAIRNALETVCQGSRLEKAERIEVDQSFQMYSSKHNAEKVYRIFEDVLRSRDHRSHCGSEW